MQIGLFRLLQGAAYRCFRESFSANHEMHLRVRSLPYRITDFVQFVQKAIALYKGLGVVEAACHPVLDAVVKSIEDEYARLENRIQNWKTVEKTKTDRIYHLYSTLKPALRLSGVRATLQKLLEKGDEEGIKEVCLIAQDDIKDLEEAVINGEFLQETYYFDPTLVDKAPHFTPEEEEFARSGVFVETT